MGIANMCNGINYEYPIHHDDSQVVETHPHVNSIAREITSESLLKKEDAVCIKADDKKLHLSYVPTEIINAIAKVREFAHGKYGEGADLWDELPEAKKRYREALLRHTVKWWKNPEGSDEESRLPHLYHIACNVAFLIELEENKNDDGVVK